MSTTLSSLKKHQITKQAETSTALSEKSLNLKTGKERFSTPLYLDSGRILEPYEVAYETYGELNEDKSNVVVVTHALSGSHHAAGFYEEDRKPGWWDGMIGSGKPIDTDKFFVICTNVVGSCFGSSAPMSFMYPSDKPYRFRFPVVTIRDMVKAQIALFTKLGIYNAKAVIGGSMGGMQALSFAVHFPSFAKKVIPLASTYATSPKVIAANKIMMEAVKNDPVFNGGDYSLEDIEQLGCPGLSTARMIGFLDYLSPATMGKKFGRRYVETDGLFELFGRFEVERYLEYNGYNFPNWFDPLSYLYLLKAISIFDISFGFEGLEEALKNVRNELHLIAFSGDLMFRSCEMREIKTCMDSIGKGEQCSFYEVQSDYGHDAFLVELDKFSYLVSDILEDKA